MKFCWGGDNKWLHQFNIIMYGGVALDLNDHSKQLFFIDECEDLPQNPKQYLTHENEKIRMLAKKLMEQEKAE